MAAELWWLQLLSEDKVSDLQNQSPLSPKHSVLFSASLKTSQTKQDDYPTWELLSGSGTFQLTLYHLSNLRLKVFEVAGGQDPSPRGKTGSQFLLSCLLVLNSLGISLWSLHPPLHL